MTDSTVFEVWRQRDAWAREARSGKRQQERARLLALSFSVCGALFGTIAGRLEVGPTATVPGTTSGVMLAALGIPSGVMLAALGVASGVLLALGGYFGRELLTAERETEWARARILAEALARECIRYLMRVPPYDGASPSRVEALRSRTASLIANVGIERNAAPVDDQVKLPVLGSLDDYVEQRALSQADWYETRSGEHRQQHLHYRTATPVIGALAVVVSVAGSTYTPALAFVPVLTTVTAALVAWIQANRIGAVVSVYQETATQLRLQVAAWRDSADFRAQLPEADQRQQANDLVEHCEEIMAQENGAWRAEWLSEEKAQHTLATLEDVTKAAEKAGGPTPAS